MFEGASRRLDLNKAFEEAVRNGDVEAVKSMFAVGDGEETPDLDFEMTNAPGIMIAAQNGDWDMVRALFNLGADVDVKIMPMRWHFIDECIVSAPEKIAKHMIEYANINAQTKKGETPLMVALARKKGVLADAILDSDRSNLSLLNVKGESAAHYAAREGEYGLLMKLALKGASLFLPNEEGKTPIDLIDDPKFKASLPDEMEKASKKAVEENEVRLATKAKEVSDIEEARLAAAKAEKTPEKKGLSGLSSIKRK